MQKIVDLTEYSLWISRLRMFELLLCSFLFLSLFYYLFVKGKTCNLPGPKGFPLIGSIFQIDLKSVHLKLYHWTSVYGEIFQFSLFGTRFVCLNSSEVIREAFSQEPNATHLSSRPPTFVGRYLLDNYGDVAFSPLSKEWVRRRKLVYQLLHTYGEGMVHIEQQISSQLKEVMEGITNQEGVPIDPQDIVEEFILNNIEVLIVGKRGKRSQELQKLLKKIIDDGNELCNPGIDVLYHLFPFLRFLPFPISRLFMGFKKQTSEMLELFKTIAKKDPEGKGIVHHLLKVRNESDSSGEEWFTDSNVKNLLLNLVSGGFLTTRGTLMSAILLLAKRRDMQEKIKNELKENIGQREIQTSDRENCPYLEAVILETLRFISHVPLSIMHYTSVDCKLRGYFIPKKSIIIPNLWTAHHSEIWENPYIFRPERFLSDTGELFPATHIVRKRLMSFGYGKRACVGENFAKSRIFLFLANVLKHFSIHESGDSPVSDLQPTDIVPGITLQPKQYKVIFQKEII